MENEISMIRPWLCIYQAFLPSFSQFLTLWLVPRVRVDKT
jgi:hypothetical protein